jgi:rsbT co-antagonist protein RsbR
LGSCDAKGQLCYLNRAGRELLGVTSEEELFGRSIATFHPEWAARKVAEEGIPTAIREGIWRAETAILRQGKEVPVAQVIVPHREADGSIQYLSSTMIDLTEQKRILGKLKEERDHTRRLIELMPLLVLVMGADGRVTYVNPAVERTSGYTASELVGTDGLSILYRDEALETALAERRKVTTSGNEIVDYEIDLTTKSGQTRRIAWTSLNRRRPDGEVIEIVGFGVDMTDRVRAEAERRALQEGIIHAQQEVLRQLSTPLVPITDDVLVMPLVGKVDPNRAQDVLETLLHGVAGRAAKVVILDITGVPMIDQQVASALIDAAKAVRLLGADVIVTGIRADVARALIDLGVDLGNIVTRSTLQSAIVYAMGRRRATPFQSPAALGNSP